MSQHPDNRPRDPRPTGADPTPTPPGRAADDGRAGYIPRVPRSAAPPAASAAPPGATPGEVPPWEDRPTMPMSVAGGAAPRPAPRPGAAPGPPPVYDPTRSPVAPPPAQRMPRRAGRIGAVLGVLAGLLVLAVIAAFAYANWYEQQYAGQFYPGVQVLGVAIGGKTQDEAHLLLENQVADFTAQPVVLTWADQQWTPQPKDLGIAVNLDRTLDNAFLVGRSGGLVENWRERWEVSGVGRVVPLSVSLNEGAIQSYLEQQVAPKIDQTLQQGDVWLQGEQVKTSPSREGRQLQVYPALVAIRQSLAALTTKRVELPVQVTLPAIAQTEIQDTARALQTMVGGPLVAHHGSKQFRVEPRPISQQLIILNRNADPAAPHHYSIGFQDANLKALVADWASEIDTAPQNARVAWNGGALTVLKESQDGVKVDQEKTIAAVKAALATPDKRNVDLPVSTGPPKVGSKDIGGLGIKELIGTGNTSFQGSSEARAINIRIAAQYLNGVVVPPGDSFSFLDAVAPITLDRGYVEGYVIAAERTQKGVGGGVCQVSTTVFRAAFASAVKITERHQHAYRVSWYESKGEPVGFDAAVFDPGVDFRFVNTTPGFLLIQTDLAGSELNVNFYGTKISDQVKLVGPRVENEKAPPPDVYQLDPSLPPGTTKQVEFAHRGLDTTITRQVFKGGQLVSEDSFFSRFEPWPNWYMVASDVPTPSPPRPPGSSPTP